MQRLTIAERLIVVALLPLAVILAARSIGAGLPPESEVTAPIRALRVRHCRGRAGGGHGLVGRPLAQRVRWRRRAKPSTPSCGRSSTACRSRAAAAAPRSIACWPASTGWPRSWASSSGATSCSSMSTASASRRGAPICRTWQASSSRRPRPGCARSRRARFALRAKADDMRTRARSRAGGVGRDRARGGKLARDERRGDTGFPSRSSSPSGRSPSRSGAARSPAATRSSARTMRARSSTRSPPPPTISARSSA